MPFIILHGLYGSSDNWLTIARHLSEKYEVIIPDMRNHGRSPHHPVHTYGEMSADVLELMDRLNIGQCILLGHSMGGKTAIHLAAREAERISRLIIDDISPVNYSSLTEHSPLALEHLNIMDNLLHTIPEQYSRREEIEQLWAKKIPDPAMRLFMLKNLQRNNNGTFEWRINIKSIARNLPQILNGMDDFSQEKYPEINIPTLFIKGELSSYIQPDMFPQIQRIFPHSEIVILPDAGHWLHVEQSGLFLAAIMQFLSDINESFI
ncbi:MAG: alpha/beta fold hydrolase [Bacteroidales bacterium]|nr:alpha/beta fold hydrolase [Bacteroidales bacterium]